MSTRRTLHMSPDGSVIATSSMGSDVHSDLTNVVQALTVEPLPTETIALRAFMGRTKALGLLRELQRAKLVNGVKDRARPRETARNEVEETWELKRRARRY